MPDPVDNDLSSDSLKPKPPLPCAQSRPGFTREMSWFELVAVLCIAVLPDLGGSLIEFFSSREPALFSSAELSLHLVYRSVFIAIAVGYILLRSDLSWADVGLRKPRFFLDPALGVLCLALVMMGYHAWWYVYALVAPVPSAEDWSSSEVSWFLAHPSSWGGVVLLIAAQLLNALAEEGVTRGYLIPRLERLLGSTWAAVLISSALFASYHIYQGVAGMFEVFVFGLVVAVFFVVTRRLWPVVLAHAAYNLTYEFGWF